MPKSALIIEILDKMKNKKGKEKDVEKEMDSKEEDMDLEQEALVDLANDIFSAIEEKDAEKFIEAMKEFMELC